MIRRLALLPLSVVALSLVLAACGSTPTVSLAPALTDPKEIVDKGATSLVDVKTFEFTGTFTGKLAAAQLGEFDLSTIKLAGAVDIPGKGARISLDAPSLLGTKLDAVLVGDRAYFKVAGALATVLRGSAEKYTMVAVPTTGTDPLAIATDITKLVTQLQGGLALLPVPPTKAPDERCGDLDCYHVAVSLTGDQLRVLDPSSTLIGNATIDLWTRKNDYRPAKIGFAIASPDAGTFGMTLELRYDVGVSVAAPPADQIAP